MSFYNLFKPVMLNSFRSKSWFVVFVGGGSVLFLCLLLLTEQFAVRSARSTRLICWCHATLSLFYSPVRPTSTMRLYCHFLYKKNKVPHITRKNLAEGATTECVMLIGMQILFWACVDVLCEGIVFFGFLWCLDKASESASWTRCGSQLLFESTWTT